MTTTLTSTLTTGQVLDSSENPFVIGTAGAMLTTPSDWAVFAPGVGKFPCLT